MVLAVVVATGNAIIWFVNRFFEPTPVVVRIPETPVSPASIDPKRIAAITAAVNAHTEGEARIDKIEKA